MEYNSNYIFDPQRFTHTKEDNVILNNMMIDWSCGHKEVIEAFVSKNRKYKKYLYKIVKQDKVKLDKEIVNLKKSSLLMTVLMLTGKCNADCDVCYTDRVDSKNNLSREEIVSVIDQTYALGSRLLYIPGEGEPTLDASFWDILEYTYKIGMNVILFTNGIIFSNDKLSIAQWGISSDDAVRRLKKYPIYVYHKLWSLKNDKYADLIRVNKDEIDWGNVTINKKNYNLPRSLILLMNNLPRERVGVQVLVEKRNIGEVIYDIMPFVINSGLKCYMETILHSGRMIAGFDCDLKEKELCIISDLLCRKNCKRMAYKTVVHNDGTISPGVAINSRIIKANVDDICEYNIRKSDGKGLKDIYYLLHNLDYIVWGRYQIDKCLCEVENNRYYKKKYPVIH